LGRWWKLRILGIDPGTRVLGFSIIDVKFTEKYSLDLSDKIKVIHKGVIRFKNFELQNQIIFITEELQKLLDEFKPDEVSLEDIFFAYNPKSVIKLAQFRGALLLYLVQNFGKVSEYTPLQVKKAITGNGQSKKEVVRDSIMQILNLDKSELKPLDISDALAIAVTHFKTEFKSKTV
jgi:crossover junction endodeoxyribonuclease RuvC